MMIILDEIKGSNNTKARSLKVYVEKYKPVRAMNFSQKNLNMGEDGMLKYVDVYLKDT